QRIWGYETTWGSFAQFTKVQAQQLLPKPRNLSWVESSAYGLTYFTAYRMLLDRCKLQAGHRVLIWGAAGGLGVFATQLCAASGADAVGVVSSEEKGELVKKLGAVGYINRSEFAGMMRRKEILGSHFANAYEAMRANDLMAEGRIRPVLWRVMPFEGVAEAHQLLHENKHLGKISILVGATDETSGKHEEGPGAVWAEV